MRFISTDPATPDATRRRPRWPLPWMLGLVAAVAALVGWYAADVVESAEPSEAEPERPNLPVLPLVGVVVAIVLFTAAWLGTEAWMASSQSYAVARALTGGDPARAAALVTRYGCGGCHTIPGLPAADGKVGPPLGGIRQRVFIAGVLPNTAENLIGWIVSPRTFSPRSAMPVTGISEAEARDVAAWLYSH
jgi:cytochrome c2